MQPEASRPRRRRFAAARRLAPENDEAYQHALAALRRPHELEAESRDEADRSVARTGRRDPARDRRGRGQRRRARGRRGRGGRPAVARRRAGGGDARARRHARRGAPGGDQPRRPRAGRAAAAREPLRGRRRGAARTLAAHSPTDLVLHAEPAEDEEEEELPAWSLPLDAVERIRVEARWPGSIDREWAFAGSTGKGVRVAILDSGIEVGHPLVGEVQAHTPSRSTQTATPRSPRTSRATAAATARRAPESSLTRARLRARQCPCAR